MSYAQLIAEHDPNDDALVFAAIRSFIAAGDLSTLKARDVRQELEKSFGPAIHERKKWISKQITAIVQETGPEAEAEAEDEPAETNSEPAQGEAEVTAGAGGAEDGGAPSAVAAANATPAAATPRAANDDEPVVVGGGITLDGCWQSSLGPSLTCQGRVVTFGSGAQDKLLVGANGAVSIDGWELLVSKSTTAKLRWRKDGQKCSWVFDDALGEGGGGVAASRSGLGERRGGVVLSGKRKRTQVDYVAMDRRMRGVSSGGGRVTSGGGLGGVRQFAPPGKRGGGEGAGRGGGSATAALLADSQAGEAARDAEDEDEEVNAASLAGEGARADFLLRLPRGGAHYCVPCLARERAGGVCCRLMPRMTARADWVRHLPSCSLSPLRCGGTGELADADSVREAAQALGAAPTAELLPRLRQLGRYPMDMHTLRVSGVALAVKPLRKHADQAVAGLAKQLFSRWKQAAVASSSADK